MPRYNQGRGGKSGRSCHGSAHWVLCPVQSFLCARHEAFASKDDICTAPASSLQKTNEGKFYNPAANLT